MDNTIDGLKITGKTGDNGACRGVVVDEIMGKVPVVQIYDPAEQGYVWTTKITEISVESVIKSILHQIWLLPGKTYTARRFGFDIKDIESINNNEGKFKRFIEHELFMIDGETLNNHICVKGGGRSDVRLNINFTRDNILELQHRLSGNPAVKESLVELVGNYLKELIAGVSEISHPHACAEFAQEKRALIKELNRKYMRGFKKTMSELQFKSRVAAGKTRGRKTKSAGKVTQKTGKLFTGKSEAVKGKKAKPKKTTPARAATKANVESGGRRCFRPDTADKMPDVPEAPKPRRWRLPWR